MNNILTLMAACCLWATAARAQRYVGGDISALPLYEAHGVSYLDTDGTAVEPLAYWHDRAGWNAARVRIFVDPSKAPADDRAEGVAQDLDYVTALARRVKAKGYALMLDFHYADTWTDPGQHTTPSAWASADPVVLADSVYQYTARVLRHLKANGVEPEMVQPGNEITQGMMWPTGRCWPDGTSVTTTSSNASGSSGTGVGTHANLVAYLRAGVRAIREVCPAAKVVVHTEMSSDWNVTTFYNTLGDKVDYDVIGLSYYPDYHGTLAKLASTLTTLETQHADKELMIVETGYGARWSLSGDYTAAVTAAWPVTEQGQRKFTTDLIAELAKHPRVTGLFWWLPEDNVCGADNSFKNRHWWNASLYLQDSGKPLAALFELQRFIGNDPTGISSISLDGSAPSPLSPPSSSLSPPSSSLSPLLSPLSSKVYNLHGQRVAPSTRLPRGIYIVGGKKVLVTR